MINKNKRKVYISYSHKDRQWLEELLLHLAPYNNILDVWSDSQLNAGENWKNQIIQEIGIADIIILLVSANYLFSSFIQNIEIKAISNARQSKGALVLPILISPCRWEQSELSNFQFLNPSDKPLSYLNKLQRDSAYADIFNRLQSILSIPATRSSSPIISNEFADEIAKKVFKLIKSDIHTMGTNTIAIENINDHISDLIFVICSFTEDMDPIFEGIKSAAKIVGLEAKRIKDFMGDYRITSQIMSMIASSRLIIADLTHERPNVYFELGYARGIGKTVITCAREGTEIHFDVKDWTYITYNDSRILEKALTDRLRFELEI